MSTTTNCYTVEQIGLSRLPSLIANFYRQIYIYREYVIQSVRRDLNTRYKRSVLGYFWTMLHPFSLMVILTIVFSHIMKFPMRDYSIFLFAGLLPWNYFQSSALMSLVSIRANVKLIGQVPLPKDLLVLSLACSNLLNLLLAVVPLLLIMLALGRPFSPTIFALPVVLLPLFLTVLGISLLLSTFGVLFDDSLHISEVVLQAIYFLSPVLYYRELLPPGLVRYLVLNPLFCQIEFFRGIFYYGVLPDLAVYLANFAGSLTVFAVGFYVFRKTESRFLYFV